MSEVLAGKFNYVSRENPTKVNNIRVMIRKSTLVFVIWG